MEASVYILFSEKLNKFYIGYTTKNINGRIEEHNSVEFENSWTSKGIPWQLLFEINCKSVNQAIKIERHIKRMKSIKYIKDIRKYPEIINRLKEKYK